MPPQQAPIMITEPHTTCAIVVMRLVQGRWAEGLRVRNRVRT